MAYYTERERIKIECLLQQKKTPKEIAAVLGRHYTSVYREINRGTVVLLDTHLKPYKKYCADVGQRKMIAAGKNKGVSLKVADKSVLIHIEKLIKDKKYSPYAVSVALRASDCSVNLSKGTIYNYIHKGIIKVSRDDLSYKTRHKKKENKSHLTYDKTGKKSIEERPKDINKRDIYGHWEMDTVYSGKSKDKSKAALLVFTERMTREEIILKIPDRQAVSVVKAVDKLERKFGSKCFKQKFKTITCDNGVEFSSHKEIERSVYTVKPRTTVYFCHAFCSCERGSNENANKLIRKFIPKGADIGVYTAAQIKAIEKAINNYPRLLFGGLSANQYKALCKITV